MRYMLFFLYLMLAIPCQAYTLRSDSPQRYVVQYGDTLWSIANRYLTDPWQWKALWHANPQIKNPNRLYPGAVIELRYHKQHPYLKVLSNGTVKLSPFLRPLPLEEAIPPIPLEDIKPFLNGSLVLDQDSLTDAPFIIAFTTEHMIGGQGDEVYVENLCPNFNLPPGETISYAIYRPCGEYHDPINKRILGYKASLVAYAELLRGGNPAAIMITDIMQGVSLQDRVMPNNHPDFDLYFEPKTPSVPIHGSIIDLPGDYTQGAVGLVAVIDRGEDSGLQAGDVLGVYSRPRMVKNSLYRYVSQPPCKKQCIKIPPERIGEMMIFRTFTHTSFALVVRSIRVVEILDTVTNP